MKEVKICLMGNGGGGKSALVVRFVQGIFYEKFDPTLRDSYRKQEVVNGENVMLEILDPAGINILPALESDIKNNHGFMLIYSITSQSDFNEVPKIADKIFSVKDTRDVPLALVGNKCDLEDERVVSQDQAKCLALEIGSSFYEVSAKTCHNVDKVFKSIVTQFLLKGEKQRHLANNRAASAYFSKQEILEEAEKHKKQHKQAYKKAIKERLKLNVRPVHLNHIGISRSGKTSFRRRLTGEILNLLAAMLKGEEFQPSTGVAEDGGQVFIRSLSTGLGTIQSRVWATVKDVKQEASMLNQCIYQAVNDSTTSALLTTTFDTSTSDVNRPAPVPRRSVPKKSTWKKFVSLIDQAKAPSKKDMEEMFSVIGEVMENAKWDEVKYLLDDMTLLINTDTGGQAEFLDLQASLVLGPSLNLLYSRLNDDLDKPFEMYYTNEKGVSTEKHYSTSTVEDILFQALASIACLGGSPLHSDDDKQARPSQSKAIFIGTHLDLITPEEFKRKDEILQQKVKNTEFYSRKIVEFASEDQMMIAVDNMKGDQKEIEKIRTLLEQIIIRNFDKIDIPAAWLVFSLCIRMTGARTMSIHECQEVAKKLRISPRKLKVALGFLHHRIGVLFYYPKIESLKDTVICDLQVVFDSASNLIKNTFTFERVGHQRSLTFKEKGQFTLNDLNKATSGYTDDLLSLEKLVDLLKDRNVLTIMPSSASSPTTEEPTYFMPCVLKSASPDELLANSRQTFTDPVPLMLRYDCGYFPIGVFPAMITNLVSQQREDWLMISEGLRKNRVQFRVGDDYDIVTLILHPQFLEIRVTRKASFETPPETLCTQVREIVQFSLDKVTSHLNYHFKMAYKFGFLCPIHHEKPRDHICVLTKASAKNMECPIDKTEAIPLQAHHKEWFSTNSSSTQAVSSASTVDYKKHSAQHCPQVQKLPSEGHQKNSSLPVLTMDNHHMVATYLADLLDEDLIALGGALGLFYPKIKRMHYLLGDMVAAWLNKEDNVMSVSGPPSWASLVQALEKIRQPGIASKIKEGLN